MIFEKRNKIIGSSLSWTYNGPKTYEDYKNFIETDSENIDPNIRDVIRHLRAIQTHEQSTTEQEENFQISGGEINKKYK